MATRRQACRSNFLEQTRREAFRKCPYDANPYRYGNESASFLQGLEQYGTRPVSATALDDDGFADLHLSDEVPHRKAMELARGISRTMMTGRDYFDLKGFSDFPPGMSYETFLEHCHSADLKHLPFEHLER